MAESPPTLGHYGSGRPTRAGVALGAIAAVQLIAAINLLQFLDAQQLIEQHEIEVAGDVGRRLEGEAAIVQQRTQFGGVGHFAKNTQDSAVAVSARTAASAAA
jgi:hypothetical protein